MTDNAVNQGINNVEKNKKTSGIVKLLEKEMRFFYHKCKSNYRTKYHKTSHQGVPLQRNT
jgi:hypothetical protein